MMTDQAPYTVAVVQHPPVWLDRATTLGRAVDLVADDLRPLRQAARA